MKRLLFISWESPDVTYLEGLFIPIFKRLRDSYELHIMQFSWQQESVAIRLKNLCAEMGIVYDFVPIRRNPHPLIGTAFTLVKGIRHIRKYVRKNHIDIIMPRSTFPSLMILKALQHSKVKIVFDADGLPLDERIDFSGLNKDGRQYKYLKNVEKRMLVKADHVLTRTNKAIDILSGEAGIARAKFSVVINGRDHSLFKPVSDEKRCEIRERMGIGKNELVLVYCGSLGPQYCVKEMLELLRRTLVRQEHTKLLILTVNIAYLQPFLDNEAELKNKVIVMKVPVKEIPVYLASSDIGLALRKATYSMQGVAPIKIGEYLLCGLPVIASSGIGDTEMILNDKAAAFVMSDHDSDRIEEAITWMLKTVEDERIVDSARNLGIQYFSLEESVISYQHALKSVE
jgi:glycosyltransferase involved in cell wall biosynthesis